MDCPIKPTLPVGWPTAARNATSWDNAPKRGMAETRTRVSAIRKRKQWSVRSLEGDLGALALELGLGSLGLLLVDTLEDRLGGALDGVLGLLEAQAGQLAHDLDDLDLLATVVLEDDVERVLLLLDRSGRGGAAT